VALNKSDIIRSLKQKGFSQRQNDHVYFNYETTDGALTDIFTKVSHGSNKTIGDSLISEMAKQCKVKRNEFIGLVTCSLNRLQYEEILKEHKDI
jgi:predicted RNA binding protein YcfA (HicA-like mRNA interferase family)